MRTNFIIICCIVICACMSGLIVLVSSAHAQASNLAPNPAPALPVPVTAQPAPASGSRLDAPIMSNVKTWILVVGAICTAAGSVLVHAYQIITAAGGFANIWARLQYGLNAPVITGPAPKVPPGWVAPPAKPGAG